MTPSSLPIRPIVDDEWSALGRLLDLAFHETHRPDEWEQFRAVAELDRTLCAFDGDRIVSSSGAYTMELTVPGAIVPAAGVTIVTVHPAYRRRGLLNAMMDRQLADLRDHGEAVAMLWASEARIYGRYGYAVACEQAAVDVARTEAGLVPDAPDTGRLDLELADPTEARDELAAVYDRMRPTRPGYVSRDDGQWFDALFDPEQRRGGSTPLQALLVRDGGTATGYALYRVKPEWDPAGPNGQLELRELQATDAAAYVACWRFLSGLDLTARVSARKMPVDAPLLYLLADHRRARVQRTDALWVRLVRVGEALAQRRYAAPVDLVLDVADGRCPWNAGRWRLAGDETGATCEPTGEAADVRVDTTVLASAYLGDGALAAYAVAGRASESTPGALRRLAAAMSWDPKPWCVHSF
ncbi:MAG: GNAT family N-acetyltransferase [Streptosporangiales bacterium]|nr:GNAT family N-acetyltransferase [Streptosporangiales bacterium]MBO0890203.1 GNAT family N-acetyltransferase [Acidothermales bacterium]